MGALAIIAGRASGSGGAAPQPDTYTVTVLTSDAEFGARDGASLVSYDGLLHLLGGWNGGLSNKEHWTSVTGATWTQKLDPETDDPIDTWALPRHTFVGTVYLEKIWAMLNDPANKTDQSAYTYSGDPAALWSLHDNSLGFPDNQTLYCHCKHVDTTGKEWIYIAGGQTGQDPQFGDTFNEYVHRYDGTTLELVGTFHLDMGPRSNSVMWSYQGKLFIGSGGEYWSNHGSGGTHTYDGRMWRSEDDGATWVLHAEANEILECQYGNGVTWNNRMWFLAGSNANDGGIGNRQGLYYSADGIAWTRVSGDTAIAARHASGICVHNDELYIVSGNLWNDAYKISIAA